MMKFNFDLIKCLPTSELTNISEIKIVGTCIVNFRQARDDSEKLEIMTWLLGTYYQQIHKSFPIERTNSIFTSFCPEILSYTHDIFYKLEKLKCEAQQIQIAKQLVTILIDCVNYFKSLDGFNLFEVNALQLCVLNVLKIFYELSSQDIFQRQAGDEYFLEFNNLISSCQHLQSLIIYFAVSEKTALFTDNANISDQAELLSQFLYQLSKIAHVITHLDVKSTAEIWKCIIKLVTLYEAQLNEYSDLKWLANCIEFIFSKMTNNIECVVQENDQNQIDRILKFNSFYLNIFKKLTPMFNGVHFRDDSVVIEGIMSVIAMERSVKNSERYDLINRHFTAGLLDLVKLIYKRKSFLAALCNITVVKGSARMSISLTIMEDLIKENDKESFDIYFANNSTNIIKLVVSSFKSADAYNIKAVTLSAIIVLCSMQWNEVFARIEDILVDLMLQNGSFLQGYLTINIWILLLQKLPPCASLHYFNFWAGVYTKSSCTLPLYSARVFLGSLLTRIYEMLSREQKEQLDSGLMEHTSLFSLFENSKNVLNVANDSVRLIHQFINGECRRKDYYQLVQNLNLISKSDAIMDDQLNTQLTALWKFLSEICNPAKFSSLIFTLLNLYSINLDLKVINEFYKSNTVPPLLEIGFYYFFQSQQHNADVKFPFRNLQLRKLMEAVPDEIGQDVEFEHVCSSESLTNGGYTDDEEEEIISAKKRKTDHQERLNLIQNIKRQASDLKMMSSENKLGSNDIRSIYEIVDILNSISN